MLAEGCLITVFAVVIILSMLADVRTATVFAATLVLPVLTGSVGPPLRTLTRLAPRADCADVGISPTKSQS